MLTVLTFNSLKEYQNTIFGQINTYDCIDIENNWIKELKNADMKNADSVNLRVIKGYGDKVNDNWPNPVHVYGTRLATTLFRHGIIKKPLKINIIPDININNKYNIKLPSTSHVYYVLP